MIVEVQEVNVELSCHLLKGTPIVSNGGTGTKTLEIPAILNLQQLEDTFRLTLYPHIPCCSMLN
jgi:hypothetical protein